MAFLHNCGIVNGDIKPDNLLLQHPPGLLSSLCGNAVRFGDIAQGGTNSPWLQATPHISIHALPGCRQQQRGCAAGGFWRLLLPHRDRHAGGGLRGADAALARARGGQNPQPRLSGRTGGVTWLMRAGIALTAGLAALLQSAPVRISPCSPAPVVHSQAALGLPYGAAIDCWGCGVVLAEMALRRMLLPCATPRDLLHQASHAAVTFMRLAALRLLQRSRFGSCSASPCDDPALPTA